MLTTFLLELRHALRALRRTPGFTLVAVSVLSLGIGVNTTVFSMLNALLLRPLPLVPEPDRLAWIGRVLSYEEFGRLATAPRAFESIAAFSGESFNVSGGTDEGDVVRSQVVTEGFFDVFGVHPSIGRAISQADVRDAAPVAVISDRLWRRRFQSGSARSIGAPITVNGLPFTVIGVMPPAFMDEVGLPHDLWVPITLQPRLSPARAGAPSMLADPDARWLNVAGRLKRGISIAGAERAIQPMLYATDPPRFAGDRDREIVLLSMIGGLDPRDRREAGPAGAILMALVSLVLFVACANVANLMLARGAERRREVAIRRALGAARGRIVAQLLAESLLVAIAAGVAGVLITMWMADVFRALPFTSSVSMTWDLSPDRRVLLFTGLASIVSAIAAGLVPALQTSQPSIVPALHHESTASGRGYRRSRLRGFLVGAQVALSLVLLVGAALLVRSLRHATTIDPGVDPRGRVLLDLNVGHVDEAQGRAIFASVLERLQAHPAIAAAAVAAFPPLTQHGSGAWSYVVEGQEPPPGSDAPSAGVNVVSEAYFDAMGIPLVRGRAFANGDRPGATGAAIVNETFARRYWPDGDPLGQRIRLGGAWHTIVGVARDGRYRTLAEGQQPHVYLPFAQHYESRMTIVARTPGSTTAAVAAMRETVRRIDPLLPVTTVQSYADAIDIAYLPARAAAIALGAFGLLALTLASAGVYAVMAYAVSRRTREIGIRVALGGRHADVVGLVLRDGLRSVAIGAAVGLVMAAGAAPLARSVLYGVSPLDPLAFAAAPALLAASALLAAYLPARRAARVDPAVALREE